MHYCAEVSTIRRIAERAKPSFKQWQYDGLSHLNKAVFQAVPEKPEEPG